MQTILIREPLLNDEAAFLSAMQNSKALHHPWVHAPFTHEEFVEYFNRYQQPDHKSFLLLNMEEQILGVFNLSQIVRSVFQNAYLGFYAAGKYAGKGYMSLGLKLVLHKVFSEMNLHRIEANIQPDNTRSISLVKANGFRKEGFSPRYLKINGEWRDHERWAITSEDWVD